MESRLAQRQNWPDWPGVQRGRGELLGLSGVLARDADVAWSQKTFLVLWGEFFFSCLAPCSLPFLGVSGKP